MSTLDMWKGRHGSRPESIPVMYQWHVECGMALAAFLGQAPTIKEEFALCGKSAVDVERDACDKARIWPG